MITTKYTHTFTTVFADAFIDVDIPHFKEVLLMAFACAHCGYKSNEVCESYIEFSSLLSATFMFLKQKTPLFSFLLLSSVFV